MYLAKSILLSYLKVQMPYSQSCPHIEAIKLPTSISCAKFRNHKLVKKGSDTNQKRQTNNRYKSDGILPYASPRKTATQSQAIESNRNGNTYPTIQSGKTLPQLRELKSEVWKIESPSPGTSTVEKKPATGG